MVRPHRIIKKRNWPAIWRLRQPAASPQIVSCTTSREVIRMQEYITPARRPLPTASPHPPPSSSFRPFSSPPLLLLRLDESPVFRLLRRETPARENERRQLKSAIDRVGGGGGGGGGEGCNRALAAKAPSGHSAAQGCTSPPPPPALPPPLPRPSPTLPPLGTSL